MSVKVDYLYVTAAGDIYRDASNSLAVTSLNSHTTNLVGPNWLAIVEGFHIDYTRNSYPPTNKLTTPVSILIKAIRPTSQQISVQIRLNLYQNLVEFRLEIRLSHDNLISIFFESIASLFASIYFDSLCYLINKERYI